VQIAGAILGGIGVLTVAALVGGIVMFIRFETAGIPSEEAVAVLPKSILLAVGASVLVPLGFVLLMSFVLVFAVRNLLAGPTGDYLVSHGHLEKNQQTRFAEVGVTWLIKRAAIVAVLAAVVYYFYLLNWRPTPWAPFAVLLAAAVAGVIACATLPGAPAGLPSGSAFGRWAWFAIVCLLVIAGFSTAFAWIRDKDQTVVRAAAALRGGTDAGVAGLFVAETKDAVYIARVDSGRGRIMVLPRSGIVELMIGEKQPVAAARATALKLLQELQDCRPPTVISSCDGKQYAGP
jgi:hypothetical protein